MICTLKPEMTAIKRECSLARPNGKCTFSWAGCLETVPECYTCNNIISVNETGYCKKYAHPQSLWNRGNCPMATHIKVEETVQKKTLDPRKAAKQRRKNKQSTTAKLSIKEALK